MPQDSKKIQRLVFSIFAVFLLIFIFGNHQSLASDEDLKKKIKEEEGAIEYLQQQANFYRKMLDESVILYIPNYEQIGILSSNVLVTIVEEWTEYVGDSEDVEDVEKREKELSDYLAVYKDKGTFLKDMTLILLLSNPEGRDSLQGYIKRMLELSNNLKKYLKNERIFEIEREISIRQKSLSDLKKRLGSSPSSAGDGFFQESDFDILQSVSPPTVLNKPLIEKQPIDYLKYSGIWQLGNNVNIMVAIEAYESETTAEFKFYDRMKSLEADYQRQRKVRSEQGGPIGHFHYNQLSERCDFWLPEKGSTWLGSRGRYRRFKNTLITISASYLDPIDEGRLVKLMEELEGRAASIVETALERLKNQY